MLGLFAAASAAQPLTTVGLELTALPEEDWIALEVLALEKKLVLRLVQDGFAVVASTANPDVRLRLSRAQPGLRLSAHSAVKDAQVEVPVDDGAISGLHLELVQRAAELARTSAPPPVVVEVAPPPAPARPPPWSPGVRLGGALGFVVRQGGTDVAVRAVLRVGRLIGGELMVGLIPSGSASVAVLEVPVLLAFSLRFELDHGLVLEGAVAGGVLIHSFFPGGAPGVQLAAMGSVPVTLSWFPLAWVGVGVRAAPSVVSAAASQPGWSRGSWWFEATGLAFLRW